MKIIGVIPARYKSTRFPGKPLADICGKPMIWWVYNQVKKANKINEVYVATDDVRIEEVCKEYSMPYVLTRSDHGTGTERLFEVAQKVDSDIYICINGDEPLIKPGIIEKIIPTSYDKDDIFVSNLMTIMTDPVEVVDNTNIKVVTDKNNNAIYMSRSPIPHPKSSLNFKYKKHVGVLAYNYKALEFFALTKRNTVENIEDINELRFIENGHRIKMIEVESESLSVDTPKDLEKVRMIIEKSLANGEIANE